MTIEEFIEARIAEDEQAANAAAGAPWDTPIPPWIHVSAKAIADDKLRFGHLGYVGTIERDADREHIARHDPARVLRQCAALRDAIESMRDCTVRRTSIDEWDRLSPKERALKYIAAIWSDHRDYQEDWAE